MVKESVWRRAWKDTEHFRNSARFFWVWEGSGAAVIGVVGGIIGVWLTPEGADRLRQYLYPAIGGAVGIIGGLVIMLVLIFIWHLFRAPYGQRDDALELAMQVQQKYESVLSAVRHKLKFVAPAVPKVTKFVDCIDVQVGAEFQNIGQEMIELKVTQFKVTLSGKTVKKPSLLTTSGFVHPSQTRDYYFEIIRLEGNPETISGTLEYEVLYSSVPNTQWYKSGRRMIIELKLVGSSVKTSYKMQEEIEE